MSIHFFIVLRDTISTVKQLIIGRNIGISYLYIKHVSRQYVTSGNDFVNGQNSGCHLVYLSVLSTDIYNSYKELTMHKITFIVKRMDDKHMCRRSIKTEKLMK